ALRSAYSMSLRNNLRSSRTTQIDTTNVSAISRVFLPLAYICRIFRAAFFRGSCRWQLISSPIVLKTRYKVACAQPVSLDSFVIDSPAICRLCSSRKSSSERLRVRLRVVRGFGDRKIVLTVPTGVLKNLSTSEAVRLL